MTNTEQEIQSCQTREPASSLGCSSAAHGRNGCHPSGEAVCIAPARLSQQKVASSPIPTFGEPGKPVLSPMLPGTWVLHAGSGQDWSPALPRAGRWLSLSPSLPSTTGKCPPADPVSPLATHPDARTLEPQASEYSPCGQQSPARGAAIPSPVPENRSIPSKMQKAEKRKGRHSPGSRQ